MGARAARPASWAGLPLLATLFVQGMPLALTVEAPVQLQEAESHEVVAQVTAKAGYQNSWLPTTIWIGIYVVAIAAIMGARPRLRDVARRHLAGVALLVMVAASALWTAYPTKIVMSVAHNVGAVVVAFAAALHYGTDTSKTVRHIGIALGLNVLIHCAAAVAAPGVAIDLDGRWMGLSGNSNAVGMIATCALWANIGSLVAPNRRRAWHLAFGAISAMIVVMSGSVTSLISAAIATAGVVALWVARRHRIHRRNLALFSGLCAVLGSATLWTFWDELTTRFGRTTDMSGRLIIWERALAVFEERPWLGWSFDDNASVISYMAFPFTHFHNGYIDLLVRGGLTGVALFLLMGFAVARDTAAASRLNPLLGVVFWPILLSMVIHNVTEVTWVSPRNIMWVLYLFVMFVTSLARRSPIPERHPLRWGATNPERQLAPIPVRLSISEPDCARGATT